VAKFSAGRRFGGKAAKSRVANRRDGRRRKSRQNAKHEISLGARGIRRINLEKASPDGAGFQGQPNKLPEAENRNARTD